MTTSPSYLPQQLLPITLFAGNQDPLGYPYATWVYVGSFHSAVHVTNARSGGYITKDTIITSTLAGNALQLATWCQLAVTSVEDPIILAIDLTLCILKFPNWTKELHIKEAWMKFPNPGFGNPCAAFFTDDLETDNRYLWLPDTVAVGDIVSIRFYHNIFRAENNFQGARYFSQSLFAFFVNYPYLVP